MASKSICSQSFMYHMYIIRWGQPFAFCKHDQLSINFSHPVPLPLINVKAVLGGEGKGRIQLYIINRQYTFKFLKPKCSKVQSKRISCPESTHLISPLGSCSIKGFWTLMARIPNKSKMNSFYCKQTSKLISPPTFFRKKKKSAG